MLTEKQFTDHSTVSNPGADRMMRNFLMNLALFVVLTLILFGTATLAKGFGEIPAVLIGIGATACFAGIVVWVHRRRISN
jgi:hypothetical protein